MLWIGIVALTAAVVIIAINAIRDLNGKDLATLGVMVLGVFAILAWLPRAIVDAMT